MTENNSKDSCKDSKIADAREFKNMLMIRTENKKRTKKSMEFDREGGKEIREYLDEVVPDWKSMSPTRLYKHIQSMLDKADQIRRFEIELVWKRAIYFIPLMVIFFTAFIGVFYMIYDADYTAWGKKIEIDKSEKAFLFFVLFLIASANAFLSFCLAKMNVGSHRWQRNWEYHVDYLQAILGVNMIRVKLPSITWPFTVRRTNILISVFIFTVWCFIILIFPLSWLILLSLESGYLEFLLKFISSNYSIWIGMILLLVGGLPALFFLTFLLYECIAGEPFYKKHSARKENDKVMFMSPLQLFSYVKEHELSPQKNKWWCVLCHCRAEDQPEKQSHQKSKTKSEVSKKSKTKSKTSKKSKAKSKANKKPT